MMRRLWTAQGLALLLCLLTIGQVRAATLTASGSDLRPFLRQLQAGDTLLLPPGTYEEGFGPDIPSGVTIQATQPRQAVIRSGNGVAIELVDPQQDITFDGLTIDKFNQAVGQGICLRGNVRNITFQNGEIRHFLSTGNRSPSMAFCSSSYQPNFTIRNNYVHDIGTNDGDLPHTESASYSYGIYLAFDGSTIEGNTFVNISAYAIHGWPTPHNDIIRNNILCNTGPLLVNGNGDNLVEGNQLYNVGNTVYAWDRGQTLMIGEGNTVRNNTVSGRMAGVCDGPPGAAPARPLPAKPRLPAPRNLRLVAP